MTIQDRIREELDNGEIDPHVIAARLTSPADRKWLTNELLEIAPGIVADIAREIISRRRRTGSDEANGQTRTERFGADVIDLMDTPVYVPGLGWKKHADLTAGDCRDVAKSYRERAAQNEWWADRYEKWAQQMIHINAQRLAELGTVATT